jgi:hypothetical protein
MKRLQEFSETERWLVACAVQDRYGGPLPIETSDTELQLDPDSAEVTTCPTFLWRARGVEFVIVKVAEGLYRSQFHYSALEQFGIGHDFEDLAECAFATLRLQSDHEKERDTLFDMPGLAPSADDTPPS